MARWAPPEIVSDALRGDEAAADRLVGAVWPGCFRLAASVIGDWSLAQDAAQEACVIVHRKIRTVRSAAAFDAWLYRIVMRESARVRRRHHDAGQSLIERAFLGGDDTAAMDVWRALASLSPELRDVTVLFYLDDLKSDEIAAILRIPHPTVRTRLARARERLRGL
ncbi:MAG: polymerase sigma factor, sigma-70 family, partial [Candidatus Eremiobacteraeota bacterium]|nr:polymerase sigma factor, sigma-70 family [Candidatus Eremiobacteraeota bacterium]